LGYIRPFASSAYKPVWRSLPSQPEWQRILTETFFESIGNSLYKYSWTFDVLQGDNEYYFAYSNPYPYSDIIKNIGFFEKMCPSDTMFYRETLVRSIDGREIEIITISNKSNFSSIEREARIPGLFPNPGLRCFKSLKPIVFISSRVHPGETPASFLLDGMLQVVLSNDLKGSALRNNFVFKIIPILNPDGVYRGNFRVDQNGVNLNRCYCEPSLSHHPSIYAAKAYFLYLSNVKFYFDLHAHNSKRCCFLFGNHLAGVEIPENQVFAKLIEINTPYFESSECDFSEKSMVSKDPKDHHTKEGSGRVALYNSSGLHHTYTIECSYNILRPLHAIAPTKNIKTGRRFIDSTIYNYSGLIPVQNRLLFNEFAIGILMAVLDIEECNPNSRLPMSNYKSLESIKSCLRTQSITQARMLNRNYSKNDFKKNDKKNKDYVISVSKPPFRRIHKLNVVSPIFNSITLNLSKKPKPGPVSRGKSLINR
jgi:cytosolic carboxypeptidase protein 5